MANTEMKRYFSVLGYSYKWLNKVQGIQEPETSINNAMHIWVQGVMNNKGGEKMVFLKGKLSPELDFRELRKPETCHLQRRHLQKGLWNSIIKQAVVPLRDICSYYFSSRNQTFWKMFSVKLQAGKLQ